MELVNKKDEDYIRVIIGKVKKGKTFVTHPTKTITLRKTSFDEVCRLVFEALNIKLKEDGKIK